MKSAVTGFDGRSRAPTPTWRNDTQVVPYGGGGCERALWAMQRAKRSVAVKSYRRIAVNNFWEPQEGRGLANKKIFFKK